MPKVIAILNGKCGVGKTTTSVYLSATFAEKQKILLVDADIKVFARWWVERRENGMDFDLYQEINPKLLGCWRQIKCSLGGIKLLSRN